MVFVGMEFKFEGGLSKSKIFLICCAAFIAGVAVASFLPLGIIQRDLLWFAGVVGGASVLVLFWENKIIRMAALAGLFLFLGIWRYSVGLPENAPDKIWHYNGQTVTVVATVSSEPDVRRNNVKYTVEARRGASPQLPPAVSGKILVTANLYPRYGYGDELEISCELLRPEPFNDFQYDKYLARYDIYSVCRYPLLRPVCVSAEQGFGERESFFDCETKNSGNWLYKNIFKVKNKIREIIDYGLTEPESGLARAIILGDKRAVPDDLREKFSNAGVSHIMAISGMHISILAEIVMFMLLGAGLWRKHAFYFAAIFLAIYIMLIGLPASAMRAGLMGFLVLWALNLGRLNKLTNSLVFAAAILLLANPKLLRDDIGFQLSFLAVAGIVYGYSALKATFREPPKIFENISMALRDIFIITISAQIFTLPIIALNFSKVSIIAPIANLLIIWILPFLMAAILSALLPGLLFPSVSFLFFLPAKLLLKYIILAVEILTKTPYAYFDINYLWRGWVVLYYGVVGWMIWAMKKRQDS